ncbi:MAG TPA: DUF4340 domain-containing protein [Bryobacteraceae bacterium]|nr:DUF4340 domain-containing protein [Bryobacteraceae bacterium]
MRIRGLLIALVVLAALGGGIYWSDKVKKAQEGKPSPDAPPQILTVAEDQFKRLEIRRSGAEPVVLEKADSGKWEMLSAPKWPVDQDAAGGIVNTLSSLASERLVEETASDLGQFGLASPGLEVLIGRKDGKTQKLLVGDDTPAGGGSFAKLDGDPRIFTIASYSKTSIEKTPRDLRDKRLLSFDSDKLSRVELTARGQTIEFGKNAQSEWQIIRPRPLRADGGQVEDLIRKLTDARMDSSATEADDKKAAAAFGGASLAGRATVTDASGAQVLEVRRDKEKNYYARGSAAEGVHKVTSDLGEALEEGLDDFRNRKVFDFGFSDPTKVEIRDGARQATYVKETDKWMSGSTQMDAATVNVLMDKLRDLAAIKFADTAPAPAVFEAAVTWNGGKRTEKVLVSRQGARCFARRENEPSVYELDPKALEEIQKAFGEIKSYQPPKQEDKKK